MKEKAKAWAPIHATLFFAVPEKKEDWLEMGSIGGGINFELGMETIVKRSDKTSVFFNGKEIDGKVSLKALEELKTAHELPDDPLKIMHFSEIPIGHGLSTSGAGAIGTIMATNELFDLQLSYTAMLQVAHIADAKCQTGLGSVLGQSVQGIELRIKQGAPGIGKVKPFYDNQEIAIIPIAPLSTSDVLVSEKQMQKVTAAGMEIVEKLKNKKSINAREIIANGKKFMLNCGLATERILSLIDELNRIGEKSATMAMIGETLIVVPENKEKLEQWVKEKGYKIFFTNPSKRPASIIRQ